MKKVGILTFYINDNYGTSLQCYALKKTIEKFGGFDVRIIPYSFMDKIENGFGSQDLREKYERRIRKFDEFLRIQIGCTDDNISILSQDNCPQYDYFIVGSDTVWNTIQTGNDETFFLNFVNNNAVKIAYAPSLGVHNPEKLNLKFFEKNIDSFDFLSVREDEYINFLRRYTSKTISSVLDPTLLLTCEDYKCLEEPIADENYILLYLVYDDTENIPYILNLANRLSYKYGCTIKHFLYNIPDYVFGDKGQSFSFASPGEFLSYVKNAKLVITNSFHGSVFSMIYHKPFYVSMRPDGKTKLSNLLAKFGLQDRILEPTFMLENIKLDVNLSSFDEVVEEQRNQSIGFLKFALGIDE